MGGLSEPPGVPRRKALHSSLVFRQLVALVMSYSFTDAEEEDAMQRTVMVPFVDLLNHHSHHHAELSFGRKHLQLVAVRSIRKVGVAEEEEEEEVGMAEEEEEGCCIHHCSPSGRRGHEHLWSPAKY